MSNKLPYLARTVSSPKRAIASAKSKNTATPVLPTPRLSSTASLALRVATSRGSKLPKDGYLRSKK